jgi:acyl carrier protein
MTGIPHIPRREMMEQIEERVTALLSSQFKVKESLIGSDVTLGNMSFDSLVLIELGLVLDKEFDVEIAEGELTEHLTVRDVVGLLQAKGATV